MIYSDYTESFAKEKGFKFDRSYKYPIEVRKRPLKWDKLDNLKKLRQLHKRLEARYCQNYMNWKFVTQQAKRNAMWRVGECVEILEKHGMCLGKLRDEYLALKAEEKEWEQRLKRWERERKEREKERRAEDRRQKAIIKQQEKEQAATRRLMRQYDRQQARTQSSLF